MASKAPKSAGSNASTHSNGKTKKGGRKQNAPSAMSGSVLAPNDAESTDKTIKIFENIVRGTPRDRNGFLTYFVDYSVIPNGFELYPQERQVQFIESGMIRLTMTEGYLSRNFTKPVWQQLEHEPDTQFLAFQTYLMHHGRSLEEAHEVIQRASSTFTAHSVREAYVFFYWHERARAYDIQRPIAAARLQDQRTHAMKDSHFNLATSLRAQLMAELVQRSKETDGRPFQGLKGTELLDGLMAWTEMGRVALDLPGKRALWKDQTYKPAANAGIERNVKDGVSNYDGVQDNKASIAARMKQNVDRILANNPEQAAVVQAAMLGVMMQAHSEMEAEGSDPEDPANSTVTASD